MKRIQTKCLSKPISMIGLALLEVPKSFMRFILLGRSGVPRSVFMKILRNVKFLLLANVKWFKLLRSLILSKSPLPAIRVLGAVSCSVRRAFHAEEVRQFESAKKCARLLGCCGFSLDVQLRYLRQFSLSKVNFGWVDRAPYLDLVLLLVFCSHLAPVSLPWG